MNQQSLFSVLDLCPVPVTAWRPPVEFPRLDNADLIAVDLETYDPQLLTHGPGWGRGVGHIVGVAVGVPDGRRWYFPIRHELPDGRPAPENFPPEQVLKWCERELTRPRQPKVGANLEYDLGWLAHEGVPVQGPLIDVQYAEPLLDEHRRSYSLDSLAETHLGENKVTPALYTWIEQAYGTKQHHRKDIYRAPVALVGPYAEGDADLPLRIWARQRPLLEQQNLLDLFRLECDLIPILVQMRLRGMPLNERKLQPNIDIMVQKRTEAERTLERLAGFKVNPDVNEHLVQAFDKLGLAYPRTKPSKTYPNGQPSFRKEFLDEHQHPICQAIRDVRRWNNYLGFAESYRDKFNTNGVIHGSYHPLRGAEGGTIVGRLSSSKPNLTNIPKRDPEAKHLLRGMFGPWPGERYRSRDYSQIQFRIMVHYAQGGGAEEARARYLSDPETDYHSMTRELILLLSGVELERGPVKNINFGLAFTMGLIKLAKSLGQTPEETKTLLDQYHAGLPWLRYTSDLIAAKANERGYIIGIGGRRHRFTHWEPRCWALRDYVKPSTDVDEVERRVNALLKKPPQHVKGRLYGGVQRAYTQLGLNRLAQDGEGTTMKRALVACHQAGIYDVTGYPLNIVHDEVNHSDPGTAASEEAFAEMKHLMETSTRWKVPLLIGDEVGPNWADLEKLT